MTKKDRETHEFLIHALVDGEDTETINLRLALEDLVPNHITDRFPDYTRAYQGTSEEMLKLNNNDK